jgi:hypothetical protein
MIDLIFNDWREYKNGNTPVVRPSRDKQTVRAASAEPLQVPLG